MKIAVYAGSFDPITRGHLDIIQRAGKQYDRVIVAVANNPAKKSMFTPDERVQMIREAFLESGTFNHEIELLPPGTMLAQWAKDKGANALVRGLRAVSDFEAEFRMALANRRLVPGIETVFFMTAQEHLFVASSTAKEIAAIGGDLTSFVPLNVVEALQGKFQ